MQRDGRRGIVYREWAPAARAASLVGEFNGWDDSANPCVKDDFVSGTLMMREAGDMSLRRALTTALLTFLPLCLSE